MKKSAYTKRLLMVALTYLSLTCTVLAQEAENQKSMEIYGFIMMDAGYNFNQIEANDNLRNQAIAHLLKAYGRMYFDPVQATDIYTKQCAIIVNAKDLAVMAATLANGGTNRGDITSTQ